MRSKLPLSPICLKHIGICSVFLEQSLPFYCNLTPEPLNIHSQTMEFYYTSVHHLPGTHSFLSALKETIIESIFTFTPYIEFYIYKIVVQSRNSFLKCFGVWVLVCMLTVWQKILCMICVPNRGQTVFLKNAICVKCHVETKEKNIQQI